MNISSGHPEKKDCKEDSEDQFVSVKPYAVTFQLLHLKTAGKDETGISKFW
jgi:hypothetical protein